MESSTLIAVGAGAEGCIPVDVTGIEAATGYTYDPETGVFTAPPQPELVPEV